MYYRINTQMFSFYYTQKRQFGNLLQQQNIRRNERDARHYAPANKEWKNSVYCYNKNNILNISSKDQIAHKSIKNYFNLVPTPIKITKSKRMRDWLKRSSIKQFFISRPEIKQNNDKAIVTLYTYDRQKLWYLRKLFLLNKWLNSNVLGIDYLKYQDIFKSYTYLVNKYNTNLLKEKHVLSLDNDKTDKIYRKYMPKHKIKHTFINKTVKSILAKRLMITNTIFFYFLTWTLSLFKIKVNIIPKTNVLKNNKKKITTVNIIRLILTNNEKQNKVIKKRCFTIRGIINIKTRKIINTILLQYILININNIDIRQINKIYSLFFIFKKRYLSTIIKTFLKKEILIIKFISRLYVNKFKFYNNLPGLKNVLTNIYGKKIQLNIINLKYLHLNSDLFTEAISVKLRDRTKSLLRVLTKSFNLVRTFVPNNMFLLSEKNKNIKVKDINTYFGKYNVINGNVLNKVFKNMFVKDYTEKSIKGLSINVKETLSSIRYKWITGIRIEAKGRLTKRYAAARALFKYKYRGTLKNLEHLKNVENKLQSPNMVMLRGEIRPNTQYTFIPSKRRIGAFGIKSWISNN